MAATTPVEQHGIGGEGQPAWQPPTPRAQASDGEGTLFAILAYSPIVLLYLPLFAVGLFLHLVGPLANGPHRAQALQDMAAAGIGSQQAASMLKQVGAGLWVPSLIGMMLLLRPARRLIARIIPIDARNEPRMP